jgi:hypothetical protein
MSKKLTCQYFEKLATERNHSVVAPGEYKNIHTTILFVCYTCQSYFVTTGHSYKNAKQTGCPECKKNLISAFQKNRITSDETKKLIALKASQRSGSLLGVSGKFHPAWKGGYGRDLNATSTEDYIWKNTLRKVFRYKCVLTGENSRLVCHHLNSWNAYPNQRFDLTNGVLLTREVHSTFHKRYKFGNNTEEQFEEFCKINYGIDWFYLKEMFIHEYALKKKTQ